MDKFAAAPSPYPFASYKVLHLVRHAQGVHNLESEKSRDPLTSFEYFDAELSSQGWQQVCDQRRYVCASGLLEKIEVVITSPMTRTLQTAVGIFRGEGQPADRFDVTPFEEENVKNAETSTFNRLPIISYELCRERMIESEDDVLWKGEKESHEAVVARGMKFIKWLCGRKEKEIAVVSHGVFLQQAMTELIKSNKCCPLMEVDPLSRVTGLESDSLSTTTHCGRIPYGLELPRDSAKENISVEEVTN
ncbi:Histidine phosphatase superfamily [Theobroma cacao]|nr:Histidine phosphatase superfamily [Theobroma cacao]